MAPVRLIERGDSRYDSSGEDLEGSEEPSDGEGEDLLHEDFEPLEESVYGWATCMVVRDVVWLSEGTEVPWHRVARLVNTVLLIVALIFLQIFLLMAVSRLLSGPAVYAIRKAYSEYEKLMYPDHTTITINNFMRGIPGYRQEELFQNMTEHQMKKVCEIPMAHPYYLGSILLLWTFTCLVELRTMGEANYRMLWVTPIVRRTADVLKPADDHCNLVEGLTPLMKAIIGGFILLPRLLTLSALLFLGCRWLTATLGLDQVLLNGLALEFMVLLKELLYKVCMSNRNRIDTQRLLIRPLREVNRASCPTFFGGQIWGVVCLLWVIFYIHYFQTVLPDYRWDVADLCAKYIKTGPLY